MGAEGEVKVVIEGDASSLVTAGQQGKGALDEVTKTAGTSSSAINKLKVDTSDLSDETKRQLGLLPALDEGNKKVAETVRGSGAEHRALHTVLSQLNRVIPGLGADLGILARGYQASAAGAAEATAANDEMMVSFGILAIAFLAIEAAVEYWDLYKSSVKAAEEQQTKSAQTMQDNTRDMLKAQQDFNTALADQKTAVSDIQTALDLQNATIESQVKARMDLLKAMEATSLAGAKDKQEEQLIKDRFALLEGSLTAAGDAQKIQNNEAALGALVRQRDYIIAQEAALKTQSTSDYQKSLPHEEITGRFTNRSGVHVTRDTVPGDPSAYQNDSKQIDDLTKKLDETNKAIDGLTKTNNKAVMEGDVSGANRPDVAVASNKPVDALKEIADRIAGGQSTSPEQSQFMTGFADYFAQKIGALKPNQDFKSADAAAKFIEDYFANNADAYNRVFQAIQDAISGGDSKMNDLAIYWENKFKQLESQNAGLANHTISQ